MMGGNAATGVDSALKRIHAAGEVSTGKGGGELATHLNQTSMAAAATGSAAEVEKLIRRLPAEERQARSAFPSIVGVDG